MRVNVAVRLALARQALGQDLRNGRAMPHEGSLLLYGPRCWRDAVDGAASGTLVHLVGITCA